MDRDRGSALSGLVRVLCTNPGGDGAARAMVMGALAPFGGIAGQIYGIGRPGTLELLGNFGWDPKEAVAFRTLTTSLPLPACHAFTKSTTVLVPWRDLFEQYPVLDDVSTNITLPETVDDVETVVACVPVIWSEQPVGVLVLILEEQAEFSRDDWLYLDGVAGVISLWLLEQRRLLIDTWRRAGPLPHAEVTLNPRQQRILELLGNGRTDVEISETLSISIHMVRQDLRAIMELLGTDSRDAATGRARDIGLLPDRRKRDGNTS